MPDGTGDDRVSCISPCAGMLGGRGAGTILKETDRVRRAEQGDNARHTPSISYVLRTDEQRPDRMEGTLVR
jgi:hypothetical protein